MLLFSVSQSPDRLSGPPSLHAQAKKAGREVKVELHLFLTSAIDLGEKSASSVNKVGYKVLNSEKEASPT
jgi:hypothetical protein